MRPEWIVELQEPDEPYAQAYRFETYPEAFDLFLHGLECSPWTAITPDAAAQEH